MDLGGQLPVTLKRDSSKTQLILDQYRNQHVDWDLGWHTGWHPYNAAHDLNKVYCKSTKEAHSGRTYKMDNSRPLQ